MSIVCKNSSNQTIERLYQWDINYDIYITGVDMSSTPLCHFCNRRSKVAYVVAPEADNGRLKATIPNALLAEPDTIFLYLYYNTTGNTNRTVYVISFPVVPRQKPQNYATIDNYLSVEMIDQTILEYIQEAAEQITDGLVSRVEALELSTGEISDELIDIREGYDGTEYQSAGDAVRAIGAAVAAIDTVHDAHVFESWTDYYNNIDPINPGDFIIVHNDGKVVVRMMGEDGTVQPMFIADTNGYVKPDTGIPFTDLSEEVQELIAGEGGEIIIGGGYKTYGFVNEAAYEVFIEDFPDALQQGDYIWINESTPTTKKYVLYRYDTTATTSNYRSHVFTINNTLYINVSIEDDEPVADTTLAQIRQALTQNRDLVLITETGVPVELSYISYSGGVAEEVQFTTTAFNGACHILGTYIINQDGLTVKSQNLTLAGIKDIIIRGPVTDNSYEIVSLPDVFNSMSDIVNAAVAGVDVRMTVVHDAHYYRVSRHLFTTILNNGETMVFSGYESVDENGENKNVLAMYSVSPSEEYVTRTEFYIDNADVSSGGGSGGSKTTWCGTCSTASSTAAKTVSLSGYALETASVVNITFTNAVNANATLNINSTGAKSIYYHGAAINSGVIGAGATALMFYDGTHYCLISTDYTYIKPSGGIPLTDLATGVQDSIGLGHKLVVTYTAQTGLANVGPDDIDDALIAGYKIVLQESNMGQYEIPLSFVNSGGNVAVFSGVIRNYSTGEATAVVYYINSSMQVTKTSTPIGGSSAQVLEVALTDGSTPTCDTSFTDIAAAFAADQIIKPRWGDYEGIVATVDQSVALFYFVDEGGGTPLWYTFAVDNTDAVTVTYRTIGDAIEPSVITNSSATPQSFFAYGDCIYKFTASAVSAITVTGISPTGDVILRFTSGSTPTTLTLPNTVQMPDGFTSPEANTRYEINISDGYALVASWAVST